MITKDKIEPEILEKILKRPEFKLRIETLSIWLACIKDPEDFKLIMKCLRDYCKDLSEPDFTEAHDPEMLNTLFNMERAKQCYAAIAYGKMCIKNEKSGKKGGEATAKRTVSERLASGKRAPSEREANGKQKEADIDYGYGYDSGSGSGSGFGIGIGLGSEGTDTKTNIENDLELDQGKENDNPPSSGPLRGPDKGEDGLTRILPEGFWDEA